MTPRTYRDGRMFGATLAELLTAGVDQRGPDECWPWTKSVDRDGYGMIGRRDYGGGDGRVRMYKAHVLAYELANGPAENSVLHRCHVERCCNPAHLYDGTEAQNSQDRIANGKLSGRPKLTVETVKAIRDLGPMTIAQMREVGKIYGVNTRTVENVVRFRTWRIDEDGNPLDGRRRENRRASA